MSQVLKQYDFRVCSLPSCRKGDSDLMPGSSTAKLLSCSRCKKLKNPDPAMYCSPEHQTEHWKMADGHKGKCNATAPECSRSSDWCAKWRKTADGSFHFGDLELVTWNHTDPDGTELGWGGAYIDEADDLKKQFENEFGCRRTKLLKAFDEAFRWTCCGVSPGAGMYGCDHHGRAEARQPCCCDFCRGGIPLSDKIWAAKLASQHARGLENVLCRGPDPRSASPAGLINLRMRKVMSPILGLD